MPSPNYFHQLLTQSDEGGGVQLTLVFNLRKTGFERAQSFSHGGLDSDRFIRIIFRSADPLVCLSLMCIQGARASRSISRGAVRGWSRIHSLNSFTPALAAFVKQTLNDQLSFSHTAADRPTNSCSFRTRTSSPPFGVLINRLPPQMLFPRYIINTKFTLASNRRARWVNFSDPAVKYNEHVTITTGDIVIQHQPCALPEVSCEYETAAC